MKRSITQARTNAGSEQITKPQERSPVSESILGMDAGIRRFLAHAPMAQAPFLLRESAIDAITALAMTEGMNSRQLDRWLRACINDEKNPEGFKEGTEPLKRWTQLNAAFFDAGIRGSDPDTTVAEFGKRYGEGTVKAVMTFIDMKGFTAATRDVTPTGIGYVLHEQDKMLRLAGFLWASIMDNFTGDGRNLITVRGTKEKTIVDGVMYGLTALELFERFNKINAHSKEFGLLGGREMHVRVGQHFGSSYLHEMGLRHTTSSADTNFAARVMGHAEAGKLSISEGMAKAIHHLFEMERRELGQTVMEKISGLEKEADAADSRCQGVLGSGTPEDKRDALVNLFRITYTIQVLCDRLDAALGKSTRSEKSEKIGMNEDTEGMLRSKELLGGLAFESREIDAVKRSVKEEIDKDGELKRSLAPYKSFNVSGYFIVKGILESQDNPYIFPVGSRIRERYLGELKGKERRGREIETYVEKIGKEYGALVGVVPNMLFPYPVSVIDALDTGVGVSKNRAVLSLCAFREMVEKIASSPDKEIKGTPLEQVKKELTALGVLRGGRIDNQRMSEIEKEFVLLPSLLLDVGKAAIADEMIGAPEKPRDEKACKRVALTNTILNEPHKASAFPGVDPKKLEKVPEISARMLREHNKTYAREGYFSLFSETTIKVVENCRTQNYWGENLGSVEGKGLQNPNLTILAAHIISGSNDVVRAVNGKPWAPQIESVDTVLASIHRYKVRRNIAIQGEVYKTLENLLKCPASARVYVDLGLFPEVA